MSSDIALMVSDVVQKAQVAGLTSSRSQVTPSSFILKPAQSVMKSVKAIEVKAAEQKRPSTAASTPALHWIPRLGICQEPLVMRR